MHSVLIKPTDDKHRFSLPTWILFKKLNITNNTKHEQKNTMRSHSRVYYKVVPTLAKLKEVLETVMKILFFDLLPGLLQKRHERNLLYLNFKLFFSLKLSYIRNVN